MSDLAILTWALGIAAAAIVAGFGLLWRGLAALRSSAFKAIGDTAAALHEHRVHVAESYVSKSLLKETEDRLTGHLTRIEDKLDTLNGKPTRR